MNKTLSIVIFICLAFAVSANAQKTGDYEITNIKAVPFEKSSGEFESEITDTDDRVFFNDLDKGIFLIIEITGKPGDYQTKKGLSVTVTEGKKIKLKKAYFSGILNEQGKFYFPVWLEPAMCDGIKITATVTGQKTISKMTKTLSFMCGE